MITRFSCRRLLNTLCGMCMHLHRLHHQVTVTYNCTSLSLMVHFWKSSNCKPLLHSASTNKHHASSHFMLGKGINIME